ncbi:MAG: BPSS1780 family membrane protein [Trinickia sp.]
MHMRAVVARQGSQWLSTGWTLFRQCPGGWILLGVIELLATAVCYALPFASELAAVFTVLWAGGMIHAADRCRANGSVGLVDVVRGIRERFRPLFAAAVFGLLIAIVCDLTGERASNALSLLAFGGAGSSDTLLALVTGAVYVSAALIGAMTLWLAPAVIVLNGAAPGDALRASFTATWRNGWAALVYGLIVAGLMVAAVLTLGVAMLVVAPLLYLSTYAASIDMFPPDR